MQLECRNLTLKALMKSREIRWNDDIKRRQAEFASLDLKLRNAKVMQEEDSEFIEFLNNLLKKQQDNMQNMLEELIDLRMKVEAVTSEKEERMDTFESAKAALAFKNNQLMTELKAMQFEILQNNDDYQLQIMALEKQRWSERLEKDVCIQRVEELVVEATEKKWFNLQGDSQNNVELTEKLETMQTQIQQSETD